MGDEHSFDIVSKVNLQELHNAVNQAQKEIANRFDFKGTSASLAFEEKPPTLKLTADHSMQMKSIVDLLEMKLVKRSVSPRALAWRDPEQLPSGGIKQQAAVQVGLPSEKAREIVKAVKEMNPKVQPRIDGDSVRVSGRQIDDLQTVIQALKGKDFGIPVQVENYR